MGRSMNFLAISTFNAEGLSLYGRRMASSFLKNWPMTVPLRIYSEGWRENIASEELDLYQSSRWLAEFKERHKSRKYKDYRWDAIRFAHKVAAVCHAARSDADVVIWLDGDIVTHSPINIDELDSLSPSGDEWVAWLDRINIYPECGFYMLNCRHPRHIEMINALQGIYEDDKLFSLPEWHDCFVLQSLVQSTGIRTKSLSGSGRKTSHPLVNGPLGKWLDHLKGRRKQLGRTNKHELSVKRSEDYWR